MSFLSTLSNYAIPFVIAYIVLYGLLHKVPVYELFLDGVAEGFTLVIKLAPTLIGLFVAIGIIRSSGGLDLIGKLLSPLTNLFGVAPEVISVSIIRLFSSSAATGMTLDIFRTYGPDSVIGNTVSILMSCTETIFYTMSVYFLAAKITKTRWTLLGSLIATLAGIIASILLAQYISL